MSLYNQHLEETKSLIKENAKNILLDKDDLELDFRMFGSLQQKAEDSILTEHITDFANKRIDNFETLISDDNLSEKYKNEIVLFLHEIYREMI